MKVSTIAIVCGKCRERFMQEEDACHMEYDFAEQRVTLICPKCKQESIMDFGNWQKKQKNSPLPPMRTM